ncbi:MAG TPA: FG-GAP-like repeat-containing protein [Gaiellaceae bacterium]
MAAVAIRGTTYPIVLPKLRDPRLHLAATITSLQVLGQVAFHFRLSIAQILVSLATVAVIEVAITVWKQHVLMWPASALLTGNGVAFVLRVPGTRHGDWWSLRGWWIYVLCAGGSLLSKYVIAWKGEHVFNPSNIGLVAVFLVLGRGRVEPLDFWWGPMSWWMALALAIIVSGGFAILRRLKLLRVALSFWAAFALGIGGVAVGGHAMTARWHLGPLHGLSFWWILVTSPEVLVFLFFMITDPKTAPRDLRARVGYGVVLGLLAAALIAPTTTEFAAKVALLSSLAIVCLVKAVLWFVPVRVTRRRAGVAAAVAVAAYAGSAVFWNTGMPKVAAAAPAPAVLPRIAIDPSPGVQTQLDRTTAQRIAYAIVTAHPIRASDTLHVHLVPGTDQSPPYAVARLAGATYRVQQTPGGAWALPGATSSARPTETAAPGRYPRQNRLENVAASTGLDFRQGSFRFGMSNDVRAMMGGGVCFVDYNGDGWIDLFAVNSYASADAPQWQAHGGLPTSELFRNDHGRFVNVTDQANAGLAVQGDGCAAGDLNGDGRPDLVVTTTTGVVVLWNHGGRFGEQRLPATGWYTGAAIADVNGDGLPDVFAAGYSDPNAPVPGSYAGFPTNLLGVRDLLFLNRGGGRFREVGVQAGLESSSFRHGLGALFTDVNGDGRPDLYVANDEDPNDLYVNVAWPGGAAADPAHLGFRFEERGAAEGAADPFAGMGIAYANRRLLVTNSRGEPSAVYRVARGRFTDARRTIDPALGKDFAGWGATWVDLANSGTPQLVVATGAIPVTSLKKDAEAVRLLARSRGDSFGPVATGFWRNGRGVAAADVGNDGRMAVAVSSIGGKLMLLRPAGRTGNWLDVRLSRFVPGAVVAAGHLSREVQAGSSYLSSEDPRVHLGLGRQRIVPQLVVTYPWGARTVLRNVRANRIVTVEVPAFHAPAPNAHTCATSAPVAAARTWNRVAVRALVDGQAPDPVQARDLYLASLATWRAYRAERTTASRSVAIAYANHRLLLWLASYDHNLARVFGEVDGAFCASPDAGAAAVGTRIANALIAQSLHDGSNERLRFADPTFTPQNAPMIVAQPGGPLHDATFWQPLALAEVSPRGAGAVPAQVQTFVGSQWGGVRTFATRAPADPGAPPLGDPSGRAYAAAALAAIRATAGGAASTVDTSPAAWNRLAWSSIPARLGADIRLELALNGALNDAAVAVYGAKRRYDAPRPIELVRYLAFSKTLPVVPGLTRRAGGVLEVRRAGRWVRGDRWTPLAPTPASPGWPSAGAAYAAAAATVVPKLASSAARADRAGVANGTETAADAAAGRKLGVAAARLALARVR